MPTQETGARHTGNDQVSLARLASPSLQPLPQRSARKTSPHSEAAPPYTTSAAISAAAADSIGTHLVLRRDQQLSGAPLAPKKKRDRKPKSKTAPTVKGATTAETTAQPDQETQSAEVLVEENESDGLESSVEEDRAELYERIGSEREDPSGLSGQIQRLYEVRCLSALKSRIC